MSPVTTVILLIGLAVLGYVAKGTFAPLPGAPGDWDALASGITLAVGIVLPFVYPPFRRAIRNSPYLPCGQVREPPNATPTGGRYRMVRPDITENLVRLGGAPRAVRRQHVPCGREAVIMSYPNAFSAGVPAGLGGEGRS